MGQADETARDGGAITYRMATVADVEALARLRWAMDLERHPDIVADYAEYVATMREVMTPEIERGTHLVFLAEAEAEAEARGAESGRGAAREPVACAVLIWWAMPPTPRQMRRRRGYVSSVYTAPDHRRQGVARRLMEQLIARAQELGVQRLLLNASDMGRPLYASLGFGPGEEMEWNG